MGSAAHLTLSYLNIVCDNKYSTSHTNIWCLNIRRQYTSFRLFVIRKIETETNWSIRKRIKRNIYLFIKDAINVYKFIRERQAKANFIAKLDSCPDASAIFPCPLVTAAVSALALRAQYQIKWMTRNRATGTRTIFSVFRYPQFDLPVDPTAALLLLREKLRCGEQAFVFPLKIISISNVGRGARAPRFSSSTAYNEVYYCYTNVLFLIRSVCSYPA